MEVIISNCTGTGYSAYGEFELHATCDIPVAAADALRLLVVTISGLSMILMALVWIVRHRLLWKKKTPFKILLISAPIICGIIILRPLLGHSAIGPQWRACTSVAIFILTNMGTSAGVSFVAYFAYIQATVLDKSSLARVPRSPQGFIVTHKAAIFGALGILQAVLFLLFALLGYFVPAIGARVGFWVPTMFILATILPFSLYLGFAVFLRLRRARTDPELQRQLLFTNVLLAVLNVTTLILAVIEITALLESANYILIELVWLLSALFMAFAFVLIARREIRGEVSPDRQHPSQGSHRTLDGLNTRHPPRGTSQRTAGASSEMAMEEETPQRETPKPSSQ